MICCACLQDRECLLLEAPYGTKRREGATSTEGNTSLLCSPYLCFQGLGRMYCLWKETAQRFPSVPLLTGFWFTGGLKSLKYLLKF